MMRIIYGVICSSLISLAQGDGTFQNVETVELSMMNSIDIAKEIKGLLSEMIKDMRADVNKSLSYVESIPNTLRGQGLEEISALYKETKNQLVLLTAPENCIDDGRLKIENLQNTGVKSFLICNNWTQEAMDIVKVTFELGKLTVNILLTADELVNGFDKCLLTWNPFKLVMCFLKWTKEVFVDIYKSFKAVREFNRNVATDLSDLRDQFLYCLNHTKSELLMHQIYVIDHINKCALS